MKFITLLLFIGLTASAATLQVKGSKGEPISGAKVMIGDANTGRQIIVTDGQGQFTSPDYWTSAETVSITAEGFTQASFFGQMPNAQIYQIRKADIVPNIEIKGTVKGFAPYMTEKDGNIDFGLVLPMLKREEIYFFNESKVLSAENDFITILGQKVPVPSNVSLPQQKEKYGFFSFTLDKPVYRTKLSYPGNYQMVAIRARTSVKALKDRLPPMELLNEIQIGGGSERSLIVGDQGAQLDFAIGEKQFNAKMGITAPADIPNDMVMLSLPLVQSGEYMHMSDVKTMKARESRQLSVPQTGANHLMNIMLASDRKKNKAASANLMAANMSQEMRFLGLIAEPSGDMRRVLTRRPTFPAGIEPGAMYVTLSQVDVQKIDNIEIERLTRLWEVFLNDWNEQIVLPVLPSDMNILKPRKVKYRWEVTFMATDNARVVRPTQQVVTDLVQDVTFITRNSFDF